MHVPGPNVKRELFLARGLSLVLLTSALLSILLDELLFGGLLLALGLVVRFKIRRLLLAERRAREEYARIFE